MSNIGPSELPPGAAPEEDTPNFIGVPADHRAPAPMRSVRRAGVAMDRGMPRPIVQTQAPDVINYPDGVAPRYTAGQENTLLAGLSPEYKAQVQTVLINAGLLTGRVTLGVWDAASASAFREVLSIANQEGWDYAQALRFVSDQSANQQNVIGGPRAQQRAPLVARLSNPDDLRRVFNHTAEAVYGRRLDQADIDRLVQSFNALEREYQQSAHVMAETGGTLTDPPDPTTFAEDQLRELNPAEAGATDIANVFDSFERIIGSIGG